MADRARAEDVQHPLRPGGEVRRLRRERIGRPRLERIGLVGRLVVGRQQPVLGQQRARGAIPPMPEAMCPRKLAAVEQVAAQEYETIDRPRRIPLLELFSTC